MLYIKAGKTVGRTVEGVGVNLRALAAAKLEQRRAMQAAPVATPSPWAYLDAANASKQGWVVSLVKRFTF